MRITGGTLTLDSGTIYNDAIASSAAVDADKMQHCYKPGTNFNTTLTGTPATREEIVFCASQIGTVRAFNALVYTPGSSASITIDLKKNGTTMCSSVITLTNSSTAKAVYAGTLSTTAFAADDILSLSMTVSSSTGMQGVYAWIELEENTAP